MHCEEIPYNNKWWGFGLGKENPQSSRFAVDDEKVAIHSVDAGDSASIVLG